MADKGKLITALSNPYVKYARRLHRRRVREKEGRCLLEGVRLVADAAGAGASFHLGFWEKSLLGMPGGEALLRRLEAKPPLGGFFEVHAQVMAELADTETPQGIVVVAARPAPDPRALLGGPVAAASAGPTPDASAARTIAVLDNVRDPGNVGTVIRSADASGAAGVVFLPGTADPFGTKALRASMGSAFHIPVVAAEQAVLAYRAEFPDLGNAGNAGAIAAAAGGPAREPARDQDGEAGETDPGEGDGEGAPGSRTRIAAGLPELLRRLRFRVLVADASAEEPYWRAEMAGKTALVLGSEAEGADPVLWSGAGRVGIPMLGAAESLNVAMAASVLFYEAARQREGWGGQRPQKDGTTGPC